MSNKKSVGNRWAVAVEGAADTLLDAGKASIEELPVTPSEEESPVPATSSQSPADVVGERLHKGSGSLQTPASPGKKASSSSTTPPAKKPSSKKVSTPAAPLMSNDGMAKESLSVQSDDATPSSIASAQTEAIAKPTVTADPIELALSVKGRKSRGGRQRTYYLDNDLAEKLTTLASELEKSESQLLREILRAVFKMND